VALYRCEALVLRVQPFGETDRLATLLAPEHGRFRALAKGAQKGRSHLSAAVQPFVRARFLLWRGRSLDGISQAEILAVPRQLGGDLGRFAAASYCCELAESVATERQEAAPLYGRLAAALMLLDAPDVAGDQAVVLRWFEIGLLGDTGFLPELGACAGCRAPLGDPAGRTRFSAAHGGLLCAGCAPTAPEGVWLSRNALRAMRHLAAAAAAAVPAVRIGPLTMAQMDHALAAAIGAVIQHPLRSRTLLDRLS
jgi:DNA repair protein RecO (recombination protein O)